MWEQIEHQFFSRNEIIWGINLTRCLGCSLGIWGIKFLYVIITDSAFSATHSLFCFNILVMSRQWVSLSSFSHFLTPSLSLSLLLWCILWPVLLTALFLKKERPLTAWVLLIHLFTVKSITTLLITQISQNVNLLLSSNRTSWPHLSCSHTIHCLEEMAVWVNKQITY